MTRAAPWNAVVAIGVLIIPISLSWCASQPAYGWGQVRTGPPGYLCWTLGIALVGAGLAGLKLKWGPLIPAFVIAETIGMVFMPVTNSRRTNTKVAIIILGVSMAIAVAMDVYHSLDRSNRQERDEDAHQQCP